MPGKPITLTPKDIQQYIGDNNVDVVADFRWAIYDGNSLCKSKEVPTITLNEYQPIGDQFLTRAAKYVRALADKDVKNNPYKDTYKAKTTGNVYTLPYFSRMMRSKTNNWVQDTSISDATQSLISRSTSKIAGKSGIMSSLVNIAPQAIERGINIATGGTLGIEYPKIWGGSDVSATYNFDFYLHNTVDADDVVENWKFIYLLTYNNSYNRRNLFIQDAPVVYRVEVPGIRYSPISVMKDLNIELIGQMRQITGEYAGIGEGPIIVPEAYHVSITMEDLFVESRQIMQGIHTDKKVEVFTEATPEAGVLNKLFGAKPPANNG